MQDNNGKRSLAVIPCYNEEMTIASIILKAKNYVDDVLVIDDGSTDETAKIAKQAGAKVIIHNANKGKSEGIKSGFSYAILNKYDYVVTLDGDGQHDPHEIPILLTTLKNNGHDITLGSRWGHTTEMPLWRKFGKRVLDYTTSLGNGGLVTDSQCGFRAFNKKAIHGLTKKMNGSNFSVESEQLIKAHDLGLNITETNISCKYNNLKNTSTKDPASHGFSVLRHIIWLIAEKRPLLFLGVPGFFLVLIGLILGINVLQYYNQTHIFLLPYAIILSSLLIIGVLAMFMGLVLNVLPQIVKHANEDNL